MRRLVLLLVLAGCAARKPPPSPALMAAVQATPPAERSTLAYWEQRTDLIHPPPPPLPQALTLPQVERWTLPNGLEVIVVPRADLPVLSFGVAVKAGGYDEERRSLGVSAFTAAMLRRGSRRSTADQISQLIDGAGGSLEAAATGEHTAVNCTVLAKDRDICLRLLREILLSPTFPETELGEVRDLLLGSINQRYDSPEELAGAHFDNLVFGDEHPDGWSLMPDDVRRIGREDLVRFWKAYYRPNNSVLVVAGAVGAVEGLRAELGKAFAAWPRGPVPPRPRFTVPERLGSRFLLIDKPDLTQTTLMFGHPGTSHGDPAWYAVTMMNYVLGGSEFSSRLMTEVRARRGLTYGIASSFGASLYRGAFEVTAATKNESAWEAFSASLAELRKMKADGPTADELAKARGFYAGSYPFSLQSASSVAGGILAAQLHGLGVDYVRELAVRLGAVDLAAARSAAATYLHPDDLAVVIVGRGDTLAPQLEKAGVKFERIPYRAPISAAARAAQR
jgi:zinc protease